MARYNSEGCNAKEGNPFASFWDTFEVDFVDSVFYGPLSYDVGRRPSVALEWQKKFPPETYPGKIYFNIS